MTVNDLSTLALYLQAAANACDKFEEAPHVVYALRELSGLYREQCGQVMEQVAQLEQDFNQWPPTNTSPYFFSEGTKISDFTIFFFKFFCNTISFSHSRELYNTKSTTNSFNSNLSYYIKNSSGKSNNGKWTLSNSKYKIKKIIFVYNKCFRQQYPFYAKWTIKN